MAYHLFIQSPEHSAAGKQALCCAAELLAEKKIIQQIFFYFQGLDQVLTMTLAEKWVTLMPSSHQLKICKTAWMARGNLPLPTGFVLSSLIDFFSEHWRDQGILLSF
jgi:sulfur relay (sulfurtransferase) complex TusBCD TusD component (DsrE family)